MCFILCCEWLYFFIHHDKSGQTQSEAMKRRIKKLKGSRSNIQAAWQKHSLAYKQAKGNRLDKKNEIGEIYCIKYSLAQGHVQCCQGNYYSMFLAAELTRDNEYKQISFQLKRGRHSVCSYKSGGEGAGTDSSLYFFDPNYGEFAIKENRVKTFFDEYFSKYGSVSEYIIYKVEKHFHNEA